MDTAHQPAHSTPARPDTRDWTFVIGESCPDCGFTPGQPHATVAERLRASVPRWQAVLARPDVAVRPEPDVWSPLEYACHVLDVTRVFTTRVEQMRSLDSPTFRAWDGEQAAVEGDYNARDPRTVASDQMIATARAAELFEALDEDAWHRPGLRGDGMRFTIATLAEYWLHEVQHHLADAER
ncbi:DinB family protein [Raineyella antarctica]|uniref:DinB family protein n=1 Tax=Raineyella antarctica TaxID=1577474 RepID=UPI001C31BAE6|nr:DinB family protein [Raineyella antarctica]